ncbi:hypothetical protein [Halococcus agarilyticus]|uniref:hypothetical protein n=1 Tax=Halococcus agarilyticus TaxID=1232219 RepID=UPI0012AB98F6|nr:hypothetical protein [Halococcus agarilyticus]
MNDLPSVVSDPESIVIVGGREDFRQASEGTNGAEGSNPTHLCSLSRNGVAERDTSPERIVFPPSRPA